MNKSFHLTENHPAKSSERFAILYFFWIGGICIASWNAIINSFDYFKNKFPKSRVDFVYPIPILIAQFIVTITITHLSKVVSYHLRIVASTCIIICLSILLPLVADEFASTDYWSFGMTLTTGIIFILGLCNNIIFSSLLAFTAQVHGKYSGNGLIGIGVFGLILSGLKQIIHLCFPDAALGEVFPTMLYVSIVLSLMVIAMFLHMAFLRSSFHQMMVEEFSPTSITDNSETESLISETPKGSEKSFSSLFALFKMTSAYCIVALIINIQTFFAYPGLILKKEMPGMDPITKSVSMVTTFSVFFTIGKVLGQYRNKYNFTTVVIVTVARFAMILFIILMALKVDLPVLNTVWFAYLNLGVFAMGIGFANVAMFFFIPEQVDKSKKEVAGFLTVISLNVGSLIGGLLVLPLQNI